MICRIRRTLPWFGVVAALLLLALPVQADDIEPEPYVEEEVEPEPEPAPEVEAEVEEEAEPETAAESGPSIQSKINDVVFVRLLYVARFVAGLPFFVFYPPHTGKRLRRGCRRAALDRALRGDVPSAARRNPGRLLSPTARRCEFHHPFL